MPSHFVDLMLSPDVQAAQARHYGRSHKPSGSTAPDRLSQDEAAFIAGLDSFYLGTVNQEGWPYIQHRGGAKGFLKVLDPSTLGFADLQGNRQLISTGNLTRDGRVCLFLMSYPLQARLKILGRVELLNPAEHPGLARTLIPLGREAGTERLFRIRVEAFDWNCPQHITRRFTEDEVQGAMAPLQHRIAELEATLARRDGKG